MAGALTENIAVLSLCGTTFDPMTEIDISMQNDPNASNYKLSIQQEQQVAEAFAVLLSNTDDPRTVGAVCVEEQPNGTGLLLRTAVNSGLQEERTANFRKIAGALRECTAGPFLNTNKAKLLTVLLRQGLGRLLRSDCHYLQTSTAYSPTFIPRKNASEGRQAGDHYKAD